MGKSFDGLGINVSTLNFVFGFSGGNSIFFFFVKKTLTFLRASKLVKILFNTVRFYYNPKHGIIYILLYICSHVHMYLGQND